MTDREGVEDNRDNSNLDDEQRASDEEIAEKLDQLWNASVLTHWNLAGQTIGRYRIERAIGHGAFGVVYKALDVQLHRVVAVKLPRPEVLLDPRKLRRFENEAKVIAGLEHPAILTVYDAELDGPVPYIVSQYCDGVDLAHWLDENPALVDASVAAAFIAELANAVNFAHRQGIVHQDLKPANILLAPKSETGASEFAQLSEFEPRVADFGMAMLAESSLRDSRSSLVLGTPLYMSPEQAINDQESIGPRSDVFALGAILYQLLTGVPPYAAPTYAAVLERLREDEPTDARSAESTDREDLQTISAKCLRRSPEDRYETAADLAADLRRYLDRMPITARKDRVWHRWWRWSLQPRRVQECMTTVIILALIRIATALFGYLLVLGLGETPPTRVESKEILMAHGFVTIPCDLLIIWMASRNANRRLRLHTYWIAFLLSLFWANYTNLVASNVLAPPLWFQRYPGARMLMFNVIGITFAAQVVCWYIGDWQRIETRGTTTTHSILKAAAIAVVVSVHALAINRY